MEQMRLLCSLIDGADETLIFIDWPLELYDTCTDAYADDFPGMYAGGFLGGGGYQVPAQSLWDGPDRAKLYDVTAGSNGICDCPGGAAACTDQSYSTGSYSSSDYGVAAQYFCNAGSGYDGPTGVGSPMGASSSTSSGIDIEPIP